MCSSLSYSVGFLRYQVLQDADGFISTGTDTDNEGQTDMRFFPNLEGVEPTTLTSFEIGLCLTIAAGLVYMFYLSVESLFGTSIKSTPPTPPAPPKD